MLTRLTLNKTVIDLIQGDITTQATDAIINAANRQLAGGGGVDGAIHRAAGWGQLQAALRQYNGCPTGSAVITEGFNLPARFIIHAVGPVYQKNNSESPRLLASAYRTSFDLAVGHGLKTVACPAISTGVYRYPLSAAAEVALQTSISFAEENPALELIRFVLFDSNGLHEFARVLAKLAPTNPS